MSRLTKSAFIHAPNSLRRIQSPKPIGYKYLTPKSRQAQPVVVSKCRGRQLTFSLISPQNLIVQWDEFDFQTGLEIKIWFTDTQEKWWKKTTTCIQQTSYSKSDSKSECKSHQLSLPSVSKQPEHFGLALGLARHMLLKSFQSVVPRPIAPMPALTPSWNLLLLIKRGRQRCYSKGSRDKEQT